MTKKTGRPKAYENENSVKMSISLRPRYRQGLELLSKIRQSSLNEALEFALADALSHQHIDEKSILDWVRPREEIIEKLLEAIVIDLDLDRSSKNLIKIRALIEEFKSMPQSLQGAEQVFIYKSLDGFEKDIALLFDYDLLVDAIREYRKESARSSLHHELLSRIIDYAQYIIDTKNLRGNWRTYEHFAKWLKATDSSINIFDYT